MYRVVEPFGNGEKEKNEFKSILHWSVSCHDSEKLQVEDGACVKKMETERRKFANSCSEKKFMTNKDIPLHGDWLQKGGVNRLIEIIELVEYSSRENLLCKAINPKK